MTFSTFGLHPDIVRGIKDLAFTRPTPIQTQAIPPAMEGHDLLACAATGSGKTAAFLLPTMHHLMALPRGKTRALVLTPTRELATQIEQNLRELATHTPITGAVVVGGLSMLPQEHAFRVGVDIIVATPGRLLDHLRHGYAKFDQLTVLILDEADRMLDMGFLPDITKILRLLPVKRQTLFFSATMPQQIVQLTRQMLRNPVTIQIERQAAPASGITQAIYPVPQHLKTKLLIELLKEDEIDSLLVFTRTKHRANRLAEYLTRNGIPCERIHGNRSQAQRDNALKQFKAGRYRVLVATDIAARGIDIAELSHVINFDVPNVPEDYIHRVGRTGRASATGDAFTFVSPEEESDLRAIERTIKKSLPRVTLPDFDYKQQPTEKLEVPLAQRMAAFRDRKSQERQAHGLRQQRSGGPPRSGGQPRPGGQPRSGGHGGQGGHGERPAGGQHSGPPKPNRFGKPNLPGKNRSGPFNSNNKGGNRRPH